MPPIPEFIPPPWFQGPQPVGPMPPPPPMLPPWLQGLGPPMPIPPPPLGGIIGPPRPPLIQGPEPPLMFMGGPLMPPRPPRENGAPRKLPRIGRPPRGTKPGAPLAPLKLPLGRVPSLPRNFLFFRSSCFFPKPFSFATLLYCSTIFMASSLSSSTKVISTKVGTATSLSSSGRAKLAVDGQRLFTAPNKNRVSLRPGRITRYLQKFHSL